jgi:hypothetical protein
MVLMTPRLTVVAIVAVLPAFLALPPSSFVHAPPPKTNTTRGLTIQSAITLHALTVPQNRLPVGCTLSPSATVRLDGSRVQGGLWAGLPIDRNPWIGTHRRVIATVRERMDGSPRTPDGPPLTGSQLSQFRLHLADGVDEGYAAIYRQPGSGQELIAVYGLRFPSGGGPLESSPARRGSENPRILRVPIGPIAVVVHGDGGECFQVIGAYLKSLSP